MAKHPVIIEVLPARARFLEYKSSIAGKGFFESATMIAGGDHITPGEVIQFLKDNFPECPAVYLSTPWGGEFSREFVLPFLEKKKIKDVIPFELEGQLPYDPAEYVYDTMQWPNIEEKQTHVVAIGALRKTIVPWLTELRDAGIVVRGVYSLLDSQMQVILACGEKDGLFLHLSRERLTLLVLSGGRPRIFRSLPFGYTELLQRLSTQWKMSKQETEALVHRLPDINEADADFLKKNFDLSKSNITILEKETEAFRKKLATELNLSLTSISLPLQDLENQFYLVQDNDSDYLRGLLNSSMPDLNAKTLVMEQTIFKGLHPGYLICAGGGLSQTSSRGIKLLQGDLKKLTAERQQRFNLTPLIIVGAAIIGFALSFFLDYKVRDHDFQVSRQMQEKVFQQFFGVKPDVNRKPSAQALEILKKEKKKTEIFRKFFNVPRLSTLLVTVNNALASETTFEMDSINWDTRVLEIQASTESFTDLSRIKDLLKNTKIFSEVISSREKAMPGSGGKNRIKFALDLKPVIEDK